MESQLDQSKRVYESRLEELETDAENGCCCCSTSMIRMQIYLVVLRSCYQIVMLCNIFIYFLCNKSYCSFGQLWGLFIDLMYFSNVVQCLQCFFKERTTLIYTFNEKLATILFIESLSNGTNKISLKYHRKNVFTLERRRSYQGSYSNNL